MPPENRRMQMEAGYPDVQERAAGKQIPGVVACRYASQGFVRAALVVGCFLLFR